MSPIDALNRPWDWLGWLSVASHVVMAFVCVRIPFLLLTASRRKDLPYRSQTIMIAAFILCSGLNHLLCVTLYWAPSYPLLVVWDVVTAVVSLAALVWLVPAIPQVVAMRTPQELQEALDKATEAARRAEAAEAGLGDKVRALEATERTLRHTNRDLQQSLAARKLLEARVRQLEEAQRPDHTGATPTQAAIARMNDTISAVAMSLTPPPPNQPPNPDPATDTGSSPA